MVDFYNGRCRLTFMDTHIAKALHMFGGQQAMAKACGVTQAAVSKWARGYRVSAESAIAIEKATNGCVSRFDLRPDIFGPAQPQEAA